MEKFLHCPQAVMKVMMRKKINLMEKFLHCPQAVIKVMIRKKVKINLMERKRCV